MHNIVPPPYARSATENVGLVPVQASCAQAERFMLNAEQFHNLPFVAAFEALMEDFLSRDEDTSYVIWGGVAVNLALIFLGCSNVHYSLHDIELFLLRKGMIYIDDDVLDQINVKLSSDPRFLMEVGGRAIINRTGLIPLDEWQRNRICLRDGDLHLNNTVLIVQRPERHFYLEAPRGTMQSLMAGGTALSMKDASDLLTVDRLARRIYRTISKVIRLEQVAKLTLNAEATARLQQLIEDYYQTLESYFASGVMEAKAREIAHEWLAAAEITSAQAGHQWLVRKTIRETIKRLAGLYGVSSLDRIGFWRIFSAYTQPSSGLLSHPLIRLMYADSPSHEVFSDIGPDSDLFHRCYAEFIRYQRPGAEALNKLYSL